MVPSDIAILICGPILVSVLLFEANRAHKIHLQKRGLFRFPVAILVSTFACLGTAVLYAKLNPYVRVQYLIGFIATRIDHVPLRSYTRIQTLSSSPSFL